MRNYKCIVGPKVTLRHSRGRALTTNNLKFGWFICRLLPLLPTILSYFEKMEGQNGVSNQEALIRRALLRSVDTVLRLPGLLLFELWVQARQNEGLAAQWKARIMNNEQVSSILEVTQMLQFAQTRNFDHSAAHVLSYSGIVRYLLQHYVPLSSLFVVLHCTYRALTSSCAYDRVDDKTGLKNPSFEDQNLEDAYVVADLLGIISIDRQPL